MTNNLLNISTIIPNFNHGHLIGRAIESVLSQAFPPIELIVVDDASTDDSIKIVKELSSSDERIKLIQRDKNCGAVRAGKLGLKASSGNYLHFLAADDFVLPDAYSKIHSAYLKFPGESFYAGEAILFHQERNNYALRPLFTPSHTNTFISAKDYARKLKFEDNHFLGMSIIVNKNKFEEHGGFDPNLGALSDSFLFRKMAITNGFVTMPNPITQWNLSLYGDSRKLLLDKSFLEEILPYAQSLISQDKHFPTWYSKKFYKRNMFAVKRIRNESKVIRKFSLNESDSRPNLFQWLIVKVDTFNYWFITAFWYIVYKPFCHGRILYNLPRHFRFKRILSN
jgi:glycosyltransferase involved in cell wall biosynthesis